MSLIRTRLMVLPCIAALVLCLCTAAFAGGASKEKKCGEDIPEGSYLTRCVKPFWKDKHTLVINCGQGVSSWRTNMGCGKVKQCNWKLEYLYNGRFDCE